MNTNIQYLHYEWLPKHARKYEISVWIQSCYNTESLIRKEADAQELILCTYILITSGRQWSLPSQPSSCSLQFSHSVGLYYITSAGNNSNPMKINKRGIKRSSNDLSYGAMPKFTIREVSGQPWKVSRHLVSGKRMIWLPSECEADVFVCSLHF